MVYAEISAPASSNWERFGEQIYDIERSVFGEKSFDRELIMADITDRGAILSLLRDADSVVGFAYALPESRNTACLVDVAIKEDYQHRKLVGVLMQPLENALRSAGFEHMTLYAMVENGYASKVAKHYAQRILESREHLGAYGMQTHFKIRL